MNPNSHYFSLLFENMFQTISIKSQDTLLLSLQLLRKQTSNKCESLS